MSQSETLVVLGAGAWGSAYAKVLGEAGNQVVIWARREDVATAINTTRQNPSYLPGFALPRNLRATTSLKNALRGVGQVYLSLPSPHLRVCLGQIRDFIPDQAILVSLMKGMEPGTSLRMSEVIAHELNWPAEQTVIVGGPNLALEVARREPAAAVAGGLDLETARRVAQKACTSYFRVYPCDDPVGVELGGVLKNLVALAAGVCAGAGWGENTKALVITRGLAELSSLILACGGRKSTFLGLSGLGDLIATCTSPLSRNFQAGRHIGHGKSLGEVKVILKHTPEGLSGLDPILRLASTHGLRLRLLESLSKLLGGNAQVKSLAEAALTGLDNEQT